MNYNNLIDVFREGGSGTGGFLSNLRLLVLDECHRLFSDRFIQDIFSILCWMRNRQGIFIDMTATPDILQHYQPKLGCSHPSYDAVRPSSG